MSYLRLAGRGFLYVSLQSAGIVQVAHSHYLGAFLVGGAISFLWWKNAHSAAHAEGKYARVCYAIGAAVGTVTGMYLGKVG